MNNLNTNKQNNLNKEINMVDEIEDIQCKFNDFILSAKTSLSKNIRTKIHNNITQIEKNNFL